MADALSLFPIMAPILESTGVAFMIGGAVAMAAHGYARNTQDLDIFFIHTDGPKVLRALRKANVPFATLADPYHYAVIPSIKNLDHRIDLLFTSDDLELDAIQWAETASFTVKGKNVILPVFPPLMLAAAKARSSREKDHFDVRQMYERGVFDPNDVVKELRNYGERDAKKMLARVLKGGR